MSYFKISVDNPQEELLSFPLNQNIKLVSSEVVEDSFIQGNITLLRNIKDTGLHNVSDLYNYNIGYVKEKFSSVPINVKIDGNNITIDPVEPLHPNSSYTLFLDKRLSKEHVELVKTASKSASKLELLIDEHSTETKTSTEYKIVVVSDPLITAKNNIVKLQLYVDDSPDKLYTIDAKSSKNTIQFYGFMLKVFDVAYGKGEEFVLKTIHAKISLENNLVVNIETVLNSSIKPAESTDVSRTLTNQDILDFYNNTKEGEKTSSLDLSNIEDDIRVEYVGYNRVLLHLDKLSAENLDLSNIELIEFPAYNRYDLECLCLYKECSCYKMDYKLIDKKTILLEFKEKDE